MDIENPRTIFRSVEMVPVPFAIAETELVDRWFLRQDSSPTRVPAGHKSAASPLFNNESGYGRMALLLGTLEASNEIRNSGFERNFVLYLRRVSQSGGL